VNQVGRLLVVSAFIPLLWGIARAQVIDLHGPARAECDYKWLSLKLPVSEYESYIESCMAEQQRKSATVIEGQGAPPIGKAVSTANALTSARVEVTLLRQRGTYLVPTVINGAATLNFVVDSGAAFVTVPANVFAKLRRDHTIRNDELLGKAKAILADGSIHEEMTFTIRSLQVGNKTVENVKGAVVPKGAMPLLGQSFLEHFKSWSIDNSKGKLVLDTASTANLPFSYAEQIAQALSHNKIYPADAIHQHEEGTVIISFTIDRNGRVADKRILQGSGSPTLDKAALDIVDRSQPFPLIPASYPLKQLTLSLPISFTLPSRRTEPK
jgi:clan AA aspartic protease (TIGR02281 family)